MEYDIVQSRSGDYLVKFLHLPLSRSAMFQLDTVYHSQVNKWTSEFILMVSFKRHADAR